MAFMFGMVYFGVLSWLRYYPFQKKPQKKPRHTCVCCFSNRCPEADVERLNAPSL